MRLPDFKVRSIEHYSSHITIETNMGWIFIDFKIVTFHFPSARIFKESRRMNRIVISDETITVNGFVIRIPPRLRRS